VVGDKEVAAKSVSVRHRHAGDLGPQAVGQLGARMVRLATERANQEETNTPSGGGVS
jgi:threonyl-tRNA synthetase